MTKGFLNNCRSAGACPALRGGSGSGGNHSTGDRTDYCAWTDGIGADTHSTLPVDRRRARAYMQGCYG